MRIFYLIKKEIQEFLRQKELAPLLFIVPLIQLFLIGNVLTTDITRLPVEIVDLSGSRVTAEIVQRIRATPLFRVRGVHEGPIDAAALLRRGEVKAVIVFRNDPAGRTRRMKVPQVQILLDGVDSNSSQIAAGYFNGIIQNYILQDINRYGGELPLEVKPLMRFNARLRSINIMGPGLIVMLLTVPLLFLGSVSLVREKEQQTIETLLISPLTPLEIYIGKAVPVTILGFLGILGGSIVFLYIFRIPFRGNILYLLLAIAIFQPAVMAYAMFISTLAKTQQEAMFFAWFSMLTFLLLSGFLTPLENTPQWIQWLARVNPMFYMMRILRELFLKGNGILFFWKDLAILAVITVVVVSLSLSTYRRFIYR